jgi:hypothetical protein
MKIVLEKFAVTTTEKNISHQGALISPDCSLNARNKLHETSKNP